MSQSPQVKLASPIWTWRDHLGAAAVRWGIGRSDYRVEPGLYAAGSPGPDAPLLCTANYKLSFDILRRALAGRDAWILVLDTDGINVWCAAGKGTFGTDELVRRLKETGAAEAVVHRTVIVPQLGAPGVAAHEVARQTGFRVVYGPVRAGDLPAFLDTGLKATPAMRRVTFPLRARLAVVPMELVLFFPKAVAALVVLFLLAGVGRHGYRLPWEATGWTAAVVAMMYLAGLVLVPALLPWLPGRAFSVKGAAAGLLAGLVLISGTSPAGGMERAAVLILGMAACSFLGLMFTGSTPYTSMSGVRREMRVAVPLQLAAGLAGLALWTAARWLWA